MTQAAGKRRTRVPLLPSGFVYDLPSLTRQQNSALPSTTSPEQSPSHEVHTTPRVENTATSSSTSSPGNPPDLQLLNLQIEKQQLELRLLELKAQSRARDLVSSSPAANKPPNIPSLETVRGGVNSGKSQGQLDHNTRIVNPQEWPHLHVPFGKARKERADVASLGG